MIYQTIKLTIELSDDAAGPAQDFDYIAGCLNALAAHFGYDPHAHGFLITRAEEARKIAEYIQAHPQDVEFKTS